MPPEFLNSREDAILVWMAVIVSYAFFKKPSGVGRALWKCGRALAQWKLLVLFGSAVLYSALIVYGAKRIDLWHEEALKVMIYWLIATGIVLLGEAVGRADPGGPAFRRRVLARVISLTIVIEFIVNLYAFPLGYELALTFIAITALGMQVVLQHDSRADPGVRKLVDRTIIVLGVVVLAHFLVRTLTDPGAFLVRENAEDFLVGPALTIALIPLLYAWAWISRWEQNRSANALASRLAHRPDSRCELPALGGEDAAVRRR